MKCPGCGRDVNENDAFCAFCGENLSSVKSSSNSESVYKYCQKCGAKLMEDTDKCPFCGFVFETKKEKQDEFMYCQHCGGKMIKGSTKCPHCGKPTSLAASNSNVKSDANERKIIAGVLAIVLGSLGIHKFYLGEIGKGILFVLFCWTGIPGLIGLIQGIIYLCSSDEDFTNKYDRNR